MNNENAIIILGSGFSGSILGRKIAEECGRKVTVIEKRDHIGGNMYDEYDQHGILVQKYGTHFLNTNTYGIIEYLSQYGELFPPDTHLLSFINGHYVQLPFNFRTVRCRRAGAHRLRRAAWHITYDGRQVEMLIFTGNIDELFGLKYGRLHYRSLDIRYTYEDKKSILPEEVVSYPQATGYTRSTEYKKITYGLDQDMPVSLIAMCASSTRWRNLKR